MVFVSSFAYYLIPSYLFPSIASLSFICWIWKDSITAQQIGSGLHGLGLGSFAFDWSTVAGFLGSPLAYPAFSIVNTLAGFFIFTYIVIPIAYWTNSFEAKRFPLFSSKTFDSTQYLLRLHLWVELCNSCFCNFTRGAFQWKVSFFCPLFYHPFGKLGEKKGKDNLVFSIDNSGTGSCISPQ